MWAALLPLLLVLLTAFLVAGIAAGHHAYLIARNVDISHLWQTRERVVVLCLVVTAAYLGHPFSHVWGLVLAPPLALLAAACLFGLRFDTRLSIRRGLNKHYIGVDPQTAATDKKVTALGVSGRTYAWLKLAGTVLFSVAALLLSSCAGSRMPDNRKNAALHLTENPTSDSASKNTDATAQKKCTDASTNSRANRASQTRKFKNKGTIIYQWGTGNSSSNAGKLEGPQGSGWGAVTDATKAQAPVQLGPGNSATDNRKAGQRNGAAATGENSQASATTTRKHWLAPVLLAVCGLLLLYSLVPLPLAGAGWLWLLIRRGRKREPETG